METFRRDDLTFTVRDAGPADAPPERTIVLLHGFPQTSAAWDEVAGRLNAQGFRTLAPDTRGMSAGARPTARSAYRIEEVVADVLALLDEAGLDAVHLVGHDWGGAIAWSVARRHPDRVRTLTVLSTPHPKAIAWASKHSTQALKSWYFAPMQVPFLPETVLMTAARTRRFPLAGLPAEHWARYADAMSDREGARGAVGLYRGMLARGQRSGGRFPRFTVPTTLVWGRHDPTLGRAAAERTAHYCHGDYRFVEVDGDHWLPEKHADSVVREIVRRVGA
ncbi:MAG: alpha/beta fold hydrolase [Mobilicoccus sp.]|nr:alpha/beta fold hydrolase [Mobilicoccus sp.]